jgi:hypothetical protein
MRRISASKSGGEHGFVTYASQPASSARSADEPITWPVQAMIGMRRVRQSRFKRRMASQPSRRGIMRSITITSGCSRSADSIASMPFVAISTRKPLALRYIPYISRVSTSSSTTKASGRSSRSPTEGCSTCPRREPLRRRTRHDHLMANSTLLGCLGRLSVALVAFEDEAHTDRYRPFSSVSRRPNSAVAPANTTVPLPSTST